MKKRPYRACCTCSTCGTCRAWIQLQVSLSSAKWVVDFFALAFSLSYLNPATAHALARCQLLSGETREECTELKKVRGGLMRVLMNLFPLG